MAERMGNKSIFMSCPRNKSIFLNVLSGSTYRSEAEKYGVGVERIRGIVIQYHRRLYIDKGVPCRNLREMRLASDEILSLFAEYHALDAKAA